MMMPLIALALITASTTQKERLILNRATDE